MLAGLIVNFIEFIVVIHFECSDTFFASELPPSLSIFGELQFP